MLNKKGITLLISALVFTAGLAIAKKNDDFSQDDLNKLLKGDKGMAGAKLEGADLRGKNLSGYDFRGADLEDANLSGANLSNANFKNADLENTNLKGAIITGTIFSGAELEYATWVDGRVCAEGSIGGCW